MTRKKRWLLAIIIPIFICFFVFGVCKIIPFEGIDVYGNRVINYGINPFDFRRCYFFWFIGIVVILALEYVIFKGKAPL